MNKKISVIIPVYNVEKYLKRCVDSVLNQTYQNLEVILVDDGSPDGCPAICDEYAIHDGRVIVLHKKNGGLSSARNAALDYPMTGDYVTFVDSDDWIAPDAYEYATKLMEIHQAQAVQFDVQLTSDEHIAMKNEKEVLQVLYGKDILEYYLDSSTRRSGGFSVCRCLFKASTAQHHRFRNGKVNEDIDYKYKVLRECDILVISNLKKYFYWQADESTSQGGLRQRDFQLREAADLLAELTSIETYGTIAFLGRVKQARTAFSLLSKIAYFGIADPKIDRKTMVKELTREHRGNLAILMRAPLPISRKILAVMFAVNFNMTEIAIKLAKKLS